MRYEQYAQKMAEQYMEKGLAGGSSIPDMGLYIDQMVSCLNSELELYAKDGQAPVTKGMISNYTKHRMLPGPDGKRYTKNHGIFMLLVFYLKSCFSMDQVQRLVKPVISNLSSEWDDDVDVPGYYEEILKSVKDSEGDLAGEVRGIIKGIKKFLNDRGSDDDMSELIMLITTLIMRSNAERFLAEKLLDEYFPEKKR